MKVTRKRFCPAAGLAVLAAACLLVGAGLTLWLHSGWRSIAPTLNDQIADASQLEGFTLSGQIGWNRYYDLLHFTLQDGKLNAEMELDAPTAKEKGKSMKNLMPKVKGKADGKLVNDILTGYLN